MTINLTHPAYMKKADESAPLNQLELMSIHALVAYQAYQQKVSEGVIKEIMATRFKIDDVAQLPSQSYDEAIKFLVDIQIDFVVN